MVPRPPLEPFPLLITAIPLSSELLAPGPLSVVLSVQQSPTANTANGPRTGAPCAPAGRYREYREPAYTNTRSRSHFRFAVPERDRSAYRERHQRPARPVPGSSPSTSPSVVSAARAFWIVRR